MTRRRRKTPVDAEIVACFQPGQPRAGLLVQVAERLSELRAMARNASPPPLNAKAERITLPARLWQLVDLRWQELGYASLSAYITGLVRYDLLVGGPHRSQVPVVRRAAQDALARETVARRTKGHKRKLYLDHLIERAEGRPLDEKEFDKIKAKIARHLQSLFTPS